MGGTLANNSAFNVSSGASVIVLQPTTNAGTMQIAANSTMSVYDNLTNSNTLRVTGKLIVGGILTAATGSTTSAV